MGKKNTWVMVRFDEAEHAAISSVAKAQDRKLAAMSRHIVSNWLKDHKWLEDDRVYHTAEEQK